MLSVADSAMGKKIRCPKCQTLLLVPALAQPVDPEPDPFADLSVGLPQPTYRPPAYQSTTAYSGGTRSANGQRKSIARLLGIAMGGAFLGTGLLAVAGMAAWSLLSMMVTRPQPIEDSFTPVATTNQPAGTNQPLTFAQPSTITQPVATALDTAPEASSVTPIAPAGRNPSETAMLAMAEKFVRHARQNEHREAVDMIDKPLFHARLYSAKGSYEAMKRDISTAELLNNFANYALDGAPIGGHRHWQIVGTSQFDGLPGVVLRYYVEPQSPLEALTDPKLFNRLGAVIKYDQLTQKAGNLFTNDGQNTSHFDRYSLGGHAIHQAFPARAGYMMLVFDGQESAPKLIDLVNVLGQVPLTRSGAHVFLSDYHTFGGHGPRETYGTQATTMTVFGLTAATLGGTWNPNEPGSKERLDQQIAAATAAEEQKRPKRLEKLVQLWERGDSALQSELDRFRRDFPNDLGFELAIVCEKMRVPKPTFGAPQDKLVAQAAKALYQQWQDPFFQYVEALIELQNGRRAEADALFAKCEAAGFAPTDYRIWRIRTALDRSDTAGMLSTLEAWHHTLAIDGLTPDKDRLAKLARRYEELEQALNPPPSLGDMMRSAPRGPFAGRRGPAGMGPPSSQMPGDFPMGPMGPPPGFGQPPAGPPPGFGTGQTPPRPPEPTGPQVTIKITSSHGFDGNAIAQKLMAALSVSGHNFSQSGQSATLKISFAGTLQEVAGAIDFGKVTAKDETTRTIEVTIP